MSAKILLPRNVIPDAARTQRLRESWVDPEVTQADLRSRGFTTVEMAAMRKELGSKASAGRSTGSVAWQERGSR